MSRPLVSVVVPLHDMGGTVGRALASVLAQEERRLEVVVVDDGSRDGGPALVRALGDPRVRVVSQENAGVSAARNRGVREAAAGLVAFLDADDEWLPGYLETILRLAGRLPDCGICGTGYWIERPDGRRRASLLRGVPPGWDEGVLPDYFAAAARSDPPLFTSALAVRREALLAVGGFPEGLAAGEDLLTWARIGARGGVAYSRSPRVVYHAVDRPGRSPDPGDAVGQGLHELFDVLPPRLLPGLREYLGFWYRMRASAAMQAGDVPLARREILRSLREAPRVGALALGGLVLLPAPAARVLFRALRAAVQGGRFAAGAAA